MVRRPGYGPRGGGGVVTRVRRWPLILIASPAAVAIWSGWVGLGVLCGFGPIHPLPGIAGGVVINTAITLPVGVEAYGAYALRAWLTPGVPERAQRFARRSAIGALALGMCGQVIYHLLSAAHAARAPWPVVMLVSCIPVITLGFGAALTHLLREAEAVVTEDATAGWSAAPVDSAGTVPQLEAVRTESTPAADAGPGGSVRSLPPSAVDRDAVVAALADEIRAAAAAGERWRPDYDALMRSTGYRRSWCEKAVRDARMAVLDPPGDDRTGQPRTAAGAA